MKILQRLQDFALQSFTLQRLIFVILVIFVILLIPSGVYAYSDVGSGYDYKTAIDYITQQGIVEGYSDGTYKPNAKINRAEFTKIIVEAKLGKNPTENAKDCFPDVKSDQWFSSYVCYAKRQGYIKGYPTGYFKPADNINLAEAAKILVNVLEVPTKAPVGTEWYSKYIEAMTDLNYLPTSFGYLSQSVNRGEMAEMVWRILAKKSDQPSTTASKLENPCYPLGEDVPSNIDMDRVRTTWLKWYNDARAKAGLSAYTYNNQLNRSAIVWSEASEDKGYMDHKRNPGDGYYDYWKITAWFKDLGLEFRNVYGVTHTENIGWGPYKCSKSDCTDDLLSAIKYTFDFYMAEKGTNYTAHYESVMNKYFKEIGLGIAIDEKAGKYYLTVHYGTEIISNPWPVCTKN